MAIVVLAAFTWPAESGVASSPPATTRRSADAFWALPNVKVFVAPASPATADRQKRPWRSAVPDERSPPRRVQPAGGVIVTPVPPTTETTARRPSPVVAAAGVVSVSEVAPLVVVVAALAGVPRRPMTTVWRTGREALAARSESPPYEAVTRCVPISRSPLVSEQVPATSVH